MNIKTWQNWAAAAVIVTIWHRLAILAVYFIIQFSNNRMPPSTNH